MPRRVTRSTAKQSNETSGPGINSTSNLPITNDPSLSTTSTSSIRNLRKRKAPAASASVDPPKASSVKKRAKHISSPPNTPGKIETAPSHRLTSEKVTTDLEMSNTRNGELVGSEVSKLKPQCRRNSSLDGSEPPQESSNHNRISHKQLDDDTEMTDAFVEPTPAEGFGEVRDDDTGDHTVDTEDSEEAGEEPYREEDYEEDDEDVFDGSYLSSAGGPNGLSTTLRALSGMVSGIPSRLREILESLRQKDDPSTQVIALQELSELLLVSTEENLSGHFSPDQFIKELVCLMQDHGPFGENPDMMLLACRCIANLMEALPASTSNVVYGGAVPVLCAKLMEIQYIDLAEQALSTLEKISVEYPTSIVREGGLTACLTYLDFFATNVQRTAVSTAANCCRNIPDDCFVTVRDVMPILLNVLGSSDQKVVEQGCQCVARIAESFRHHPTKLEQLLSKDMLKAILQLLLPGTANLVGPHIHTQFLRVLAITAKASPRLSMDLLKMNIVDTLFQILTGMSPPGEMSIKNSSVMIMQSLIHKPREQIFETLNVICELLPGFPEDEIFEKLGMTDSIVKLSQYDSADNTADDERRQLLKEHFTDLRRFAAILLPTLTDAYTSTVNLSVRQKVLSAQMRMIYNIETEILKDTLSGIQFASHLATILSQRDQYSLILYGLQAAELLLRRLPDVYRYHFYREGVIAEIEKLAIQVDGNVRRSQPRDRHDDGESEDSHDSDEQPESSPVSSRSSCSSRNAPLVALSKNVSDQKWTIFNIAQRFVGIYEKDETAPMKCKAKEIMDSLTTLSKSLTQETSRTEIFHQLSMYFNDLDPLSSVSSFELLSSGIVDSLLTILEGSGNEDTRRSFLQVFMLRGQFGETPFGVLVKKLQDLLSRSEKFEVTTVHQNYEGNRSSASMLAKQLRLKLVAGEESDIPRQYRGVNVSIHAIATFKALDDYLRPRIYISERPKSGSRSAGLSSALAAFAAAAGLPHPSNTSNPVAPNIPREAASSSLSKKPKHSKTARRNVSRKSSGGAGGQSRVSDTAEKEPKRNHQYHDEKERLECSDDKTLANDNEDMDGMDDVLEDLGGEMRVEGTEDADAVDVGVASGKVSARKGDGTQVTAPCAAPTSKSSHISANTSRMDCVNMGKSSMSDWHIEFSINNHPISNDMTIYKAVQLNKKSRNDDSSSRNIWSAVHPVNFRRVPGPAPPDPPLSPTARESMSTTVPSSIDNEKITSAILRLLSVLHALNANIEDVFQDEDTGRPIAQPLSLFVNTKLTAKLNRQLEEPLIVASACLPSWSEDLARFYPFVFPFETRHLYLQSTSFGYSRSMTRWQNNQQSGDSRHDRYRDDNRPFLGRLQRQKVRISRERILESAIKVMEIYGAAPSVLEVEYFEEVGTGLGPTLEFYSSVSRAFVGKKYKLWRANGFNCVCDHAFGEQGLFPAPVGKGTANTENGKKLLNLFKILGKFVARSMLDSRIIDIFFNPMFFRIDYDSIQLSLGALKSVDKDLANSLKLLRKFAIAKKEIDDNPILTYHGKQQRANEIQFDGVYVEDLELDFTLPGYSHIEIVPNGSNTKVTIENVGAYVDGVIDLTLGSGVKEQIQAFRLGFSQVFPYNALRSFTPDELVMLFGQVEENWSLETLMDSLKADHGYNLDSKTVQNLLQVMSEYNNIERREFLQFVTGSPKLPIGGFKALTPLLTVVCKASEHPYTSDDYLPSVMTCVNYLKLPDYSNITTLRARLQIAIREGQGAFHLS